MGKPAGSNNWVVDKDHTDIGQAFVVNDPHLSLNYPANFHLSHLIGSEDQLNVQGAIFPGVPATLIGRGSHVGWGVTVVGYDVTDLYVEKLVFQGQNPVGIEFKGNTTTRDKVIRRELAVSPGEPSGDSITVSPAVEAAQALMSTGRVQAARQRLLAMAADGSPDVAWALARAYDPNHLKGIQGADAGPDVAEATRWYRTWYAAAVKRHMITDSVSLEKIIGSMQP